MFSKPNRKIWKFLNSIRTTSLLRPQMLLYNSSSKHSKLNLPKSDHKIDESNWMQNNERFQIKMYLKNGDDENALQVINKMKDRKHSPSYYRFLMNILMDKQKYKELIELYDNMITHNIHPDSIQYTMLLKAANKLKLYHKADQIYEVIQQSEKGIGMIFNHENDSLCNLLISTLGKSGNVTAIMEIWEYVRNNWNTILNGTTVNTIMQAHLSNKKYQEVLDIFDEFVPLSNQIVHSDIQSGMKPNRIYTYMKCCQAIQELMCNDRAQALYLMVKNDKSMNIYSDFDLCTYLIRMFGKCGDLDTVNDIWQLCELKDNLSSWNCIAEVYYKDNNYDMVLNLFDEMMTYIDTKKITVTWKSDNLCVFWSIKICTELDYVNKGNEIHKKLTKLWKNRPNLRCCQSLVEMFGKFGDTDNVLNVSNQAGFKNTIMYFNCMIRYWIDKGDNMKAFELFDKMQNEFKHQPNINTYVPMLRACGNYKKLIDSMYQHMLSNGWKIENECTLSASLIDAYGKCGDINTAEDIWNKYKENSKNGSQGHIIWIAIIKAYLENDYIEKAKELFVEIKNKDIECARLVIAETV